MPIRFEKYIDIQSGVAGAQTVATRSFGGRIYTTNPLVSATAMLEFFDADDVESFFGEASEEYARAVKYFGYRSPTLTSPKRLQFSRWQNVATPTSIYGASGKNASLAALQAITAGAINFVIGGVTEEVSGIDLHADVSLAAMAATITTAINLNANPVLHTGVVSFDATNQRFTLIGGDATPAEITTISVTSNGGPTDLATLLAWTAATSANFVAGAPESSPVNTFIQDKQQNNNFGSFLFMGALQMADAVAVATQNKTYNNFAQFCVHVTEATYVAWQAALTGIGGVGITFELSTNTDYKEMNPMCILGATDFTATGGVPGYMFTQFPSDTADVTDDNTSPAPTSDVLDALRINYYGLTQTNGQKVAFYQRGLLQGGATDPSAMNVYGNEQWLKDFAGTTIFNLFMALKNIGANAPSVAQVKGLFPTTIIPAALKNGTIAVGKPLTVDQQAFITETTDDPLAWQKVQNNGFWYDVELVSTVAAGGDTEWSMKYTLIYSKDDLVLSVTGTHALI